MCCVSGRYPVGVNTLTEIKDWAAEGHSRIDCTAELLTKAAEVLAPELGDKLRFKEGRAAGVYLEVRDDQINVLWAIEYSVTSDKLVMNRFTESKLTVKVRKLLTEAGML